MRTRLLLLMNIAGTWCYVLGQAAPPPSRFDVVWIKPSGQQNTNKTFRLTPDGGFRAGNYNLKDLIRLGWDVRDFQIAGGPGWLDTERYNVQAKPDVPFSPLSAGGKRDSERCCGRCSRTVSACRSISKERDERILPCTSTRIAETEADGRREGADHADAGWQRSNVGY
jgi:hypothetical protein